MKTINTLSKVTDIITKVFGIVAVCGLIFNVVIIMANVVLRYFGSSVVGCEEYVSMGEIVIIFMALGFTQYNHGLVHVAFFMKKLPGLLPNIMWAIHAWLGTLVIALLCYETWIRIPAVKQVTTSLLIPYKPFYYVLFVGAFIYLIAQLFEAVKSTVGIFNKEVRADVQANWPA